MPIAVVSAGIVCSVGLTAPAACAAIRASLDNFKETAFIDDAGQPIVGAAIPPGVLGLDEEADGSIVGGDHRLARMLALAVGECVLGAGRVDVGRTALLLVGPGDDRAALSREGPRRCFSACEATLGQRLHGESRAMLMGGPGLVEALSQARQLLSAGAVHSVLVAGVDSLLNPADIRTSLRDERVRTTENSDGFIPGEAAACVLVTPGAGHAASRRRELSIVGLGAAREPAAWSTGKSNTGRGLAQAMRQALEQGGMRADAVNQRLSDCSGESFFFDEATYAWGRVLRAPSPPGYSQLLVASSVGEVGAAVGPLMLAFAADAARRGWAGPSFLLHLSAGGSPRAALVAVTS